MKLSNYICGLLAASAIFYAPATLAADKSEIADIIIVDTKVITVSSNFSTADAIAIRGDRIIAVGRDRQIEAYKGPNTKIIDGKNKVVMPGLYDGQVHSYAAAVSELAGPWPTLNSIAAVQDYLRQQAAKKRAGSWIILEQLYPTRIKEGRLPTPDELNEAAPNNPVYVDAGEISIVNAKALDVSGITSETSNPFGGEIEKDRRSDKPTGVLRNAKDLLKLPLPPLPPTLAERRAALEHLYGLYNEQGITSIAETETTPAAIDLFRDLNQAGKLTVRINCGRTLERGTNLDNSIDRLDAMTNCAPGHVPYGPTGVGDDWVRIGPLQPVIDGDLRRGGAYLRSPWGIGDTFLITEPAYRGVLYPDPDYFRDTCSAAAQRGWQIAGHCSGDAGMDYLVHAYQYVQFKTDLHDRRFSMSPAVFQGPQDWQACEDLNFGAMLLPISLYKDGDRLLAMLREKRMNFFLPLKSWYVCKLIIGAGSDHQAGLDSINALNPWNPWLGMWVTLQRETEGGTVINAPERLTREQAVRMYTVNNACLNFEEHIKGSLEPGKLADLIMIDRDILKCPVAKVKDTKVLLTMVGGKIVWEAK